MIPRTADSPSLKSLVGRESGYPLLTLGPGSWNTPTHLQRLHLTTWSVVVFMSPSPPVTGKRIFPCLVPTLPWRQPPRPPFPMFCGSGAHSTLVTCGFMVGLLLAVACHRQEEFPGTLILLSTLPSKPMLRESHNPLHAPHLAPSHRVSCSHSRREVTWVGSQLQKVSQWWLMPCPMPQEQKDHEVEASLDSIVRSCLRKREVKDEKKKRRLWGEVRKGMVDGLKGTGCSQLFESILFASAPT